MANKIKPRPFLSSVVFSFINAGTLFLLSQSQSDNFMKMACIALGCTNLLLAIGVLILWFVRRP